MSAQIAYKTSAAPVQFAFLSKPPPSQKRRAALGSPPPCPAYSPPPPPTPRSSAFASIANWASQVQPGSPAPRSPHRRPSVSSSRRPSITRRPSISHSRARSGSSFVHLVDTQSIATPSVANFDLTNHGYTSVFVHLPKTPTTPSPLLKQYDQTHRAGQPAALHPKPVAVPLSASGFAFARIPIPPIPQESDVERKRKGMKRFRSLTILRPKAKALQAAPASPTKTAASIKSSASKVKKSVKSNAALTITAAPSKDARAETFAATIAKRKRAKYANVGPPPTLANELAIMQFADGGNMESHIKRVMDAQAKAAAGSGASVGVADVYRDENGGIWWDADEELEYAHLLGGADSHLHTKDAMVVDTDADVDMDWEEFDDGNVAAEPFSTYFNPPIGNMQHNSSNKENADPEAPTRRSSLSTVDSDLDPKYLVPLPENEDPKLAPIDDRVLASRRIGGAGMSVLSLPARPRRRAMHLCKPAFLVDVQAWEVPPSPSPVPAGPSSPTRSSTLALTSKHLVGGSATKLKGKARRRPAPLKLGPVAASMRSAARQYSVSASTPLPPVPAPVVVPAVKLSPGGIQRTRNEFIADSFAPELPETTFVDVVHPRPSTTTLDTQSTSASVAFSSRAPTPSTNNKSAKSKLAMGVRGLFRRGD